MFDPSQPAQTRDGRVALVLSTDDHRSMGGYAYPIRAKVEHPKEPGEWVEWGYMANGQWKSNDLENNNDLLNRTMQ